MKNLKGQLRLVWLVPPLIAVLLVGGAAQAATASDPYPETRKVLVELVITGHSAVRHYRQSALQAWRENLPHMADLFNAMAVSQLVMTRNFERFLTELDGSVSACALSGIQRSTTRQNLIRAIQFDRELVTFCKRGKS